MDAKIERNREIYEARIKGTSFKELVQKYGMSYEDYGTSYEVPDELTATFDKITKIAKDTQDNY